MVKHISEHEWYTEYEHDVLNGDKSIVIVFGAAWCSACENLISTLNDLTFDVEILHVDVDECETLADEYDVTSLPTIVVYENCEISNVFNNNYPIPDIVTYIKGME